MSHSELWDRDLAGSRNAAGKQLAPGQGRTGDGPVYVQPVSRHHGLRLTNRGAALLITVSAVFFVVCTYIGLGQ